MDVEGSERIIIEDLDTDDITIEKMIIELHDEILSVKDINLIFTILFRRYLYIYGFDSERVLLRKIANPTSFKNIVGSGNVRHLLTSKYDISSILSCAGILVKT